MHDQLIRFFKLGMDRNIMEPVPMSEWPVGRALNVGAGNKDIPGTTPLDLPDWNADTDLFLTRMGALQGSTRIISLSM